MSLTISYCIVELQIIFKMIFLCSSSTAVIEYIIPVKHTLDFSEGLLSDTKIEHNGNTYDLGIYEVFIIT